MEDKPNRSDFEVGPYIGVEVKWMNSTHMKGVESIDRRVHGPKCWGIDGLKQFVRHGKRIARVALYCDEVVGYFGLELAPKGFHVVRLTVSPEFRGKHVGQQLIGSVKERLSNANVRKYIRVVIPERNSDIIEWYIHMNFKFLKLMPDYFGDQDGVGLVFREENE